MRPTRHCLSMLIACVLSFSFFSATIVHARVELDPPQREDAPTQEDLNGVAISPDGEAIAVGDAATVLRRVESMAGSKWSSLGAWAAGFFTDEIFTVEHSPFTDSGKSTWVIGGRGVVVETDFTDTTILQQNIGSIYTPLLPTEDEIWFGSPDLGLAPSFLWRWDRSEEQAAGIAFTLGPVLAMCQIPGGNLRYVTTGGDIEEIDDDLNVTVLWNQDDANPLELNAATFSDDCESIIAGDAGPLSRIYTGRAIGRLAFGPSPSPWDFVDRPGEPIVTAAEFLTKEELGGLVALFGVILRCEDSMVQTGDDATMSALADLAASRIRGVWLYNQLQKCQRDGSVLPFPSLGPLGGQGDGSFQYLSVGTNGLIERVRGITPLFWDGFESGDSSLWSMAVSP